MLELTVLGPKMRVLTNNFSPTGMMLRPELAALGRLLDSMLAKVAPLCVDGVVFRRLG
jgi:hypothetical protein